MEYKPDWSGVQLEPREARSVYGVLWELSSAGYDTPI